MATNPPPESYSVASPGRTTVLADVLIAVAVIYWLFQVAWFWRYCGHNINADAISYIGIARHVADGNFRASLHGYWSPLVSWLIAAVSFADADYTRAGHLLMLPIFALCLIFLYRFTHKLWGSRLLSAIAVLWFVAARGIAAFSVCFIGADLLLTAAVLVYFTLLLGCLEHPRDGWRWIALGVAHAVAFFAKAIAMPLLAFATMLAALSVLGKTPRAAARALILAAIFPVLVWAGWGTALRQKYGVFTTGYQLHWNLLDPAVRQSVNRSSSLIILHDARSTYDYYMVADAMPPGSGAWQAGIWSPTLLRRIMHHEIENVPQAGKEVLVLLTPGGVLALLVCVVQLTRRRQKCPSHFRLIWIVLLTTCALVVAYAMLVFDGRYVIPVAPVLMGFAVRFIFPAGKPRDLPSHDLDQAGRLQAIAGALTVLGLIAVQIYWASPFRTIKHDFQSSVHEAASALTKGEARSVIVIGEGPYPEHGVGWEAGVYAAYFAASPVVGDLFDVPQQASVESVVSDIGKLSPDAIMIWGVPPRAKYSGLVDALRERYPGARMTNIRDPIRGEVGTVLVLKTPPVTHPEGQKRGLPPVTGRVPHEVSS